jgi:ABC-type glycerol-3-phosphate transport system substrate-binding protein
MNLLPNWGGHIFNEAGTRCILDIPETILTVEKTVWDPLHRYDYSPTPGEEMAMASAGGWGSGIIDLFGAGKSAMAIGGRWWLCLLRRPDYDDLRMGVVEIPKGTVGKVGAYGKATLINAETEHLDGALAFMEFMHSRKFNELINEQADGLAAIKEYCYTDDYLFNPEYPDETYNEVFRNACENAVAQEICPYVNGQRVDINLVKQIDLVRTGQKRPAEAMRDAAEAINEEIIKHLSIDEDLRGKYKRAISEGAEPAWDEPEDAPW